MSSERANRAACVLAKNATNVEESDVWLRSYTMIFWFDQLRDALPTTTNLCRRWVSVAESCSGCSAEQEDVHHVLLSCGFARLVWAISGLPWGVIECWTNSVEDWLRDVYRVLRGPEFDYFLSLCWALWWMRNKRIFEGLNMDDPEVIPMAQRCCGNTFPWSLEAPRRGEG
ncbi:UNVERIFIED_CONTAM: hypothetical protein Sindi_2706900 [Sesamum indicum]